MMLQAVATAMLVAATEKTFQVPAKTSTMVQREPASGSKRYMLKQKFHVDVPAACGGEGSAEFLATDADSGRVFVVNSCDKKIGVYMLTAEGLTEDPAKAIDLSAVGVPNSVAFHPTAKVLAVAISPSKDVTGSVRFYDKDLKLVADVGAGYNPDHVSFGPTGKCAYAANEGENVMKDGKFVDPVGGITEVCVNDFATAAAADYKAKTYTFQGDFGHPDVHSAFDTSAADPEPEFIAYGQVGEDGVYEVYVGLQENAAIAVFRTKGAADDTVPELHRIIPLGFKDYGLVSNAMDFNKDDDKAVLKAWKNLYGMYQPDTMKSFVHDGKTYLIYANEGDAKAPDEGGAYDEETTVKKLKDAGLLDASFDSYVDEIGGLKVTSKRGLDAETGKYTKLYSFGARSFSILDPTDGDAKVVFDSGNQMERMMQKYFPKLHNANDGMFSKMDSRSDDKGVEPESLAVGNIGETRLAFVGFERPGVIGVWDISKPAAPMFHSLGAHMDCAGEKSKIVDPEALYFVEQAKSPTGKPLLLASGAVSNTLTVFEVLEEHPTVENICLCGADCFVEETASPATPLPLVSSTPLPASSDDRLSDGELVAVILGSVAASAIVLGLVGYFITSSAPHRVSPGDNAPDMA